QAVHEIQALVDRIAANDPHFHATVRCYFARDPFEAKAGSRIVETLAQVATAAERVGDTPWMDAALCQAAGIDTVVFDPTGAGAHAGVEWVDLDSVIQLARVLAETAVLYCG
ncbi:MAG: acetylornithine deacetylase, partial [Acidobacteria bacterium]|nr:acetylornithine deacetylase [Acidobacteriota bacterium]